MSSGEPFDLMLTVPFGSSTFNTMASQNQFMDITELLNQYGQGVLDTVGDLIAGTTKNGKVYGVTTYRVLNSNIHAIMRTDVLEDLGLLEKAQNMTSLTEYEEILEAVKTSEKWNYLAGVQVRHRRTCREVRAPKELSAARLCDPPEAQLSAGIVTRC